MQTLSAQPYPSVQNEMRPKDCGVIAVRAELDGSWVHVELAAVHCAASMAIGFSDAAMKSPQVQMHIMYILPPPASTYMPILAWSYYSDIMPG